MPVSYSSVARNLFLLGSSGADAVVNFFKSVDKSPAVALTEGQFVPKGGIKYNYSDEKYFISGTALENDDFAWIEKRDYNGANGSSTLDWEDRLYPTVTGADLTLNDMELDSSNNLIVAGKVGTVPWIAKYSNTGVLDWQSTTNTGDLEYRSVTSDSNGNYYACGSTPESGEALAFVEKFDASGNPSWGKSAFMLGRDIVLEKISANSRGEVIAVGYLEDDSANKGYIVKIDTNTGEVLWDRTLERSIVGSAGIIPADVKCTACYIDSNDQIYVVGTVDGNNPVNNGVGEFLIKYTAEGNIVWQRENNTDQWTPLDGAPNMIPFDVWSDGETEQTVVLSVEDQGSFALNDSDLFISKYTRNGDIVFRRKISKGGDNLGTAGLDGDSSYYYVVFRDQQISGFDPDRYTFGKVSSSGNGLGTFNYNDGSGSGDDVDYIAISNPENKIGKMSDGSVSNSSSDLMTYPFGANKLVFDDLATHVSNKRRQLDSADSFEYSGSPAIRPADFQELNLLGENVSDRIWTDTSGKGNNGVASLTEPFFGAGSVSFGGKSVNDYLEIASHPDFDQTQAQTLEYWILFTNLSGNTIPVGRGDDYIGITVVGTGGGYQLWVSQFGGQSLVSGSSTYVVENDIWYHIAFTKEADPGQSLSPEWKLFVNGDLKNIFYTSQEQTLSAPLQIGRDPDSTSSLEGFISNLRIVNGSQVYTENFTPPTTPLTAIPGTVLLTCQGDTIADASSNNFTVTANGNAAPAVVGPTYNTSGYWEFDGVDDKMIIPYTPNLAFTDAIFSCEVWVYADTLVDGGKEFSIINKRGNNSTQNSNRPYVFGVNGDGRVRWILDGATTVCDTASGLIQTGQWYHLAATHDGTNAKIYVNGIENVSVASGTSSLNDTGDIPTRIGWRYQNSSINYNDGKIGEVRIYPRALTPAQVFQNYNASRYKYDGIAASTSPKITTNPIVMNSNLLLNYDFGNDFCIEKSSNVSTSNYQFILDNATTNGAAFGDSRCVSTGYGKVVVGARGETNGIYSAGGKAFVYNSSTGVLEVTLTPSDILGNDWNFGNSVAICNCSGKIAVSSNNALYLYDADGTNEIIINESSTLPIIPPGGNTFGNGLAISGNRVWVSDDNVPSGVSYSGTVYCFNAETGAFIYELRPKNILDNFTRYGSVIAAGGGKLAIGAENITHPVTGRSTTGRVYLYDVDGRNEKIIEPDILTTNSYFGFEDIAIDYGMIVVGASRQQRFEDPGAVGSGEVYVFDIEGDLKFSIRPSDDPANENNDSFGFGSSVAVSSDRIIVGARYYAGNAGGVAGRAYQFTHKGKELQAWFGIGDGEPVVNGSGFGSSMDAVGGTLVIGAGSGSSDSSGRAYVYPLTGTPSGNILNLSSSSYPGTINGATFNPAGYFDFDGPPGLGAGDYINIGTTSTFNWIHDRTESGWAIEGWYLNDRDEEYGALISNNSGTSTVGFYMGQRNDSLFECVINKGTTGTQACRVLSTNVLDHDTWYHIMFVNDNYTIKMYVNGVLQSNAGDQNSFATSSSADAQTDLRIAKLADSPTWNLDGEIGEVRIYQTSLSATEVSQNFNATRGKYGV